MPAIYPPTSGPNSATWGQALEHDHAQNTPSPSNASTGVSPASSPASSIEASSQFLSEDESMAATTDMDIAVDSESLVAAYLSRQESGLAREYDVAMETNVRAPALLTKHSVQTCSDAISLIKNSGGLPPIPRHTGHPLYRSLNRCIFH